ncbi:PREDICTED: uncharacterized protein LOC108759865 [Trachymyrmex cornetzi]|uniref:uncharacterized protein LOC108759865 n=1 Tax=Trachymyrmex cornetzi TaxID=471704 RepID=UPI00084EDD71|nr:PREDICTED: uncharacterized protein LOC108759865 [Trachymyrmex cornetzi]
MGHMRELPEPVHNAWPHFYMPHDCIIKEASSTTKLRDPFYIKTVLPYFCDSAPTSFNIRYREDVSANSYGYSTKVIQQLAKLEAHKSPEGAAVARRDFYIDDFISGADTLVEAIEIRDQVSALLEAGGFKLRKWVSNSKSLLDGMRNTSSDNQLLELDKFGAAKTLGVNWNPEEDIFDPLGLLGPVITRAKILMQRIWRSNVDWDNPLPPKINAEYSGLAIFRAYRALERSECLAELGATLWKETITWRSMDSQMPVRALTARVYISAVLTQMERRKCTYFLYWIRAVNKKLPVFVAHRMGDIQDSTTVEDWRYVQGKENPADLISRGASIKDFMDSRIWWNEPQFASEGPTRGTIQADRL